MAKETQLEYQQWGHLVARQQLVSSADISCDGHAGDRGQCLQEIEPSESNLEKPHIQPAAVFLNRSKAESRCSSDSGVRIC